MWETNSLCDVLCGALGRQHDWRRKLCPLYRSTARLTHQAKTACISRSPRCRTNLTVDSACTRVYKLNRRHGSRTWPTRWIYIGDVVWRLYERFRRIRAMVTAAVAHYQRGRGDVHSTVYTMPRRPPGGAAGTTTLSPRGGSIIVECGSCASILSTAALAHVRPVGSGTHALRAARATHPSRTCHAASAGKAIL